MFFYFMAGKYKKTDLKIPIYDIFMIILHVFQFINLFLFWPSAVMFDFDAKTLFLNCKTII